MNKNELINVFLSKLLKIKPEQDPVLKHYAMAATYADCKYLASRHGFRNEHFEDLWHKAMERADV